MTDVEPVEDDRPEDDRDERTGLAAATERMRQQTLWVDPQIQEAMARGDFDDLPGAGKPLRGLDRPDPGWWLRGLVEREQLTGLAPPAIALRTEDAELDSRLDQLGNEAAVREALEDFNQRILEARRQLLGGPPVITATRDVAAEVAAWRERRTARAQARRAQNAAQKHPAAPAPITVTSRSRWTDWVTRRLRRPTTGER